MTASSCPARTESERGWVLLSALVISTLYFAMIALILWESTVRYRAAQRFRSRVVAQTLAENAAELVAGGLSSAAPGRIDETIDDGTMIAEVTVAGDSGKGTFHITAAGRSGGVQGVDASVEVWGHLAAGRSVIDRTRHSQ